MNQEKPKKTMKKIALSRKKLEIVLAIVIVLGIAGIFWLVQNDNQGSSSEHIQEEITYELSDINRLRYASSPDELESAVGQLLDEQNNETKSFLVQNLGDYYMELDRYDQAIEQYKKSLEFMEDNANHVHYERIAIAYERLSQNEDAIKYYRLALENFDDHDNPFAEDEINRLEQAISTLQDSLR